MKHFVFRRVRLFVLSLGLGLVVGGVARAQEAQTHARGDGGVSSSAQKNIARRVRSFYAFWVRGTKSSHDPLKNRAMVRAYSSQRLARWLYSPAYLEYDADYFLQAQDFDNDWDQARVADVRVQGNTASATATLGHPKPASKGIGERRLRLHLVSEGGQWKIDRVAAVGN